MGKLKIQINYFLSYLMQNFRYTTYIIYNNLTIELLINFINIPIYIYLISTQKQKYK
jgi:hypothetical protein